MTEDNNAPRPSRPGTTRPGPVSPTRRRHGGRGTSAASSSQRASAFAAAASVGRLDALAAGGRLASVAASNAREHALLGSAVYAVAWPIVFSRVTRSVEMQRGHRGCMGSVHTLAPECLDGFEDDVAAVVDYVLRFADTPISNLGGWIASRVQKACVDGHRRRRGQRGALQRPRLPEFVASGLAGDPWLCFLAVAVLTWVGLPMTAGCGLWPLEEWGRSREARVPGSDAGDGAAVERDIETVLTAMRARPAWYERYVEVPLGRKQPPVYPTADAVPPALRIVETHEFDDAMLVRLAGLALDEARLRLDAGQPPRDAVAAAIGGAFGESCAAWGADRPPHQDPLPADRIAALLRDPAEVDRLVGAVLDIVAQEKEVIAVA
ncbi:MAG TPA: hypothetical protein VL551_31540 [Actinospica sp.]|nr:hypothetical protein [Actinospica sp.]